MSKFKSLKKGDVLSETQYYTVMEVFPGKVKVKSDDDVVIELGAGYVDQCVTSASQFEKTEKLTRTALAEKFLTSTRVALTVNFNQKVDEKSVEEKLRTALSKPKSVDVKTLVKEVTTGEERTLVGRHYGHVNEFGRVQIVDMEVVKDSSKPYDVRLRQVDPRSINWLIVDSVKYEKK